MKVFQTLLFLVIIILIGGMAALYWGKSVQEATAPVEVVEEPTEPVQEELSSGSYLVFQVDQTNFYRLLLGEATYRSQPSSADLVKLADVDQPLTVSGGLFAEIYGQHLLLHRYLDEDQDGILSLEGEVIETRPTQWGTIRSANGRYQVDFEMDRGNSRAAITNLTVIDRETESVLLERVMDPAELDGGWDLEPFMIDDRGAFVYIHEVCGCEATVSGIWQVEIATGELTRLDELVDLDSWSLSSLDPNTRGLLSISTDREPAPEGPYDDLLPPTTIHILDLESFEVEDLLVDEERAWDRPWLDPNGNDRYLVRRWDEASRLYLVDFDDSEIGEENLLTDGWVLDWVGDWLVVQNNQDLTLKLVNVESKEEVLLEIPGERVEYVGSIELE